MQHSLNVPRRSIKKVDNSEFRDAIPLHSLHSCEKLFGKNISFLRAANVVLFDTRIPVEARVLYFLIESLVRCYGRNEGQIAYSVLARYLGIDPSNVRKWLQIIREDNPSCVLPLLRVAGPERGLRTYRLIPIEQAYGLSPIGEIPRQFPTSATFGDIHGLWVSSHGFTMLPDQILRDPSLTPEAKIAAAVIICHAGADRLCRPKLSLRQIGDVLGFSSPNGVRKVLGKINPRFSKYAPTIRPLFGCLDESEGGSLRFELNADEICRRLEAPVLEDSLFEDRRFVNAPPSPAAQPDRRSVNEGDSLPAHPPVHLAPNPENIGTSGVKGSDSLSAQPPIHQPPNIIRSEERIPTHTLEKALRVCGESSILNSQIDARTIEGLLEAVDDPEKMVMTLDILAHNLNQNKNLAAKIANFATYSIGCYRKGIIPTKGYVPFYERWKKTPKMFDVSQPELEFAGAPTGFRKAFQRMPDGLKNLFKRFEHQLAIQEEPGRCLVICDLKAMVPLFSAEKGEVQKHLREEGFDDLEIIENIEYLRQKNKPVSSS